MSTGTQRTPAAPASGSGGSVPSGSGGGSSSKAPSKVSATRIKAAAANPFNAPSGVNLKPLTGENWNVWSGTMSALMQFNSVDSILTHDACLSGVDADDWDSVQMKTKAYLRLYCVADVYSTVESDTDYPTFKDKFEQLRDTYGGVGSTAAFNIWIELTQAWLDDTSPLAPQLAKLNEARLKLSNARMGVSDIQYCLILLNVLPDSYEVVASTLLASGPVSSLKHSEINARILNEEGRKLGPSASLNAARAGKKSHLTCHYCNKKGHFERDCHRKKRDEAEKKQKEGEDSTDGDTDSSDSESGKALNAFELVFSG